MSVLGESLCTYIILSQTRHGLKGLRIDSLIVSVVIPIGLPVDKLLTWRRRYHSTYTNIYIKRVRIYKHSLECANCIVILFRIKDVYRLLVRVKLCRLFDFLYLYIIIFKYPTKVQNIKFFFYYYMLVDIQIKRRLFYNDIHVDTLHTIA